MNQNIESLNYLFSLSIPNNIAEYDTDTYRQHGCCYVKNPYTHTCEICYSPLPTCSRTENCYVKSLLSTATHIASYLFEENIHHLQTTRRVERLKSNESVVMFLIF